MKLSVKSDYAARAILALARRAHSDTPVPLETLASENGIPANYLVQILLELKAQNIVRSHRGKEGGYSLARPAAEITLADIVRSAHGHTFDTPAIHDPQCPQELRSAWQRVQEAINKTLESINFQELADEGTEKAKMYYI